jgi:hypothetical protein
MVEGVLRLSWLSILRVADAVLDQAALRDHTQLTHPLRVEEPTHHYIAILSPVPFELHG